MVHRLRNYYINKTNAHMKFVGKYLKCAILHCIILLYVIDNEFLKAN